jgi:hypothetical protein
MALYEYPKVARIACFKIGLELCETFNNRGPQEHILKVKFGLTCPDKETKKQTLAFSPQANYTD